MSHAADRPRPNPVWLLVVVVMAGLALAGPVIMVRDRLAADAAAAPKAAEGRCRPRRPERQGRPGAR